MSVLIRGLEMPRSCFDCPMRWKVSPEDIKCLATGEMFKETFAGTIETRNRGNCPLVEFPRNKTLLYANDRVWEVVESVYIHEAVPVIPADKEEKTGDD